MTEINYCVIISLDKMKYIEANEADLVEFTADISNAMRFSTKGKANNFINDHYNILLTNVLFVAYVKASYNVTNIKPI